MKKVIFSIAALWAVLVFSTSQVWATPKLSSPEGAQEVVLLLQPQANPQELLQLLSQRAGVSQVRWHGTGQIRLTTEVSQLNQLKQIHGVARVLKLATTQRDLVAQAVVNQEPMTPMPTATLPLLCAPDKPRCLPPTPICDPAACEQLTPTPTPFATCDPRIDGCSYPTPYPTPTYSPDEVGAIAGVVTDKVSGLPIAGIQVCAKPAYWYPMPDDKATLTPTPTPIAPRGRQSDMMPPIGWGNCADTLADGRYEITSLLPLEYMVTFYDVNNSYIAQDYNPDNHSWGYTAVTVVAKETQGDINLALAKGGHITGRVTNSDGQSVGSDSYIIVAAYQKEGENWVWRNYAQVDSQTGIYTVTNLPKGIYRVGSSGSWGSFYFETFYANAPKLEQATDITVMAGKTTADINMVVQDPNGHITGKVTDANGQPIANVYVEVSQWQEWGWGGVSKAMTQADGQYDVAHLSTGTYRLGFHDWNGQYLAIYYQNAADIESATDIEVTAGQTTSGINVMMSTGGTISGKVTNNQGQPLVKVEVCALPMKWQEEPTDPMPTPTPMIKPRQMRLTPTPTPGGDMPYPGFSNCTYTAEDGRYTVGRLTEGEYVVQFFSYENHYLSEYYDNVATWDTATPLMVMLGQPVTNINATLSSGGSITGQVTDEVTAKPLANIMVCGIPVTNSWQNCVTTDEKGNYTLTNLGAGQYVVAFMDYNLGYLNEYYDNQTPIEQATRLEIKAEQTVTNINAAMTKGGMISGTVRDAAGKPLANIGVTVYMTNTVDNKMGSFWGQTDEQGQYKVGGLAAGAYYVGFQDWGYYQNGSRYSQKYYENAFSLADATPVRVQGSDTTADINIVLERGGEIMGKLTSASGLALGGVTIEAYLWIDQSWQQMAWGYSDYDGNYKVEGLGTGVYRLHFVPGAIYYPMSSSQLPPINSDVNYVAEYYDNAPDLASATDIKVTVGQTTSGINATLSDGGHITGQVTDMNGKAISGISVEVYRQQGEGPGMAGSGFTNEQGIYDVAGLETGSYLIRFWDGQKRYAYEFYNDVAELTQATAIRVKVGEITSNINVQLGGAMPPIANVAAPNSEVSYDTRGLATITQSSNQKSDVMVEMAATVCNGTVSNVTLHMDSLTYLMTLATNGMYQATIPSSQLIHGATLTVSMDCNGSATENRVGQFLFADQAVPEPGTDSTIKKVYLPLVLK